MPPAVATLDYDASTATELRARPSPGIALALCLPGLLCWSLFLNMIFGTVLGRQVGPLAGLIGVLTFPLWLAAIGTAVASLVFYVRGRKPWYVWLNLAINLAGLLFTLGVVGFLLTMSWFSPPTS